MPLQPVTPSTIGLWRAADWKRGMPGLYALVTGVSAYPWLRGGRLHDPAVDCGGMEQLVSSAATAAALFDWLTSRYRCDGLPLVWCALLLSPTDAERAQLQQQGLTHYGDPSYANLCEAIAQWTGQLPDRPDAAALSRSLFFFSGHGVSANWDPLLLPADYLNQDAGKPRLQNCISTRDLRDWMEDNPVAEHLALIDACRNEFKPLAERGASGHGVFPANPAGAGAPRTAARLASTSPGAVSFSLPDQPATVFGQAVLEALNGMAPTAGPRVEFRELVDYVGPRVTAILREFAPDGPSQVVRQTIDGDDELVVTQIDGPTPSGAPMPSPVPMAAATRGGGPGFTGAPAPAAGLRNATPVPLEAMRQDFGLAHQRLGHEYASGLWMRTVSLHALADGTRLEAHTEVVAVERDEAAHRVVVDLALPARDGGALLLLEGAENVEGGSLGVQLPTDPMVRVPVRLELALAPSSDDGRWRIQQVQARLGPCDWNPHYAYLWTLTEAAEEHGLARAAEAADMNRLVAAAQDKLNAPTAAVAGLVLLAAAGRLGRVWDWPRNLMQWFPQMSDGAVLWAEAVRQARQRQDLASLQVKDGTAEMAAALRLLPQRGLPFFADNLDLCRRLLRQARREATADAARAELESTDRWLDQALEAARPCGHFVAIAASPRPRGWGTGDAPLEAGEMIALLKGRRP